MIRKKVEFPTWGTKINSMRKIIKTSMESTWSIIEMVEVRVDFTISI